MKKLILFFMFHSIFVSAQLSDSFDDRDFSSYPGWEGDTLKFIINDLCQLQLNASPENGFAYLSTPSKAINNAVWEFFIKMEFNPSSNNYVKIYLVSNKSDLGASLQGYFVKIGNTKDEISLYRQSGDTEVEIIDGQDDRIDYSPVTLQVKITRDNIGNWELFSDTLGNKQYYFEGSVFDNTFIQSHFFGLSCYYTQTRSDKFYFDDFFVSGNYFADTIPPSLIKLVVLSNTELELKFSEALERGPAEKKSNYFVNNTIGYPDSVLLGNSDPGSVYLYYAKSFADGIRNTLTINNIMDVNGNTIETITNDFIYYIVKPYDIVINEIMADPFPSIGLPEFEYIELYNNSPYDINLADWNIIFGSKSRVIPAFELKTDSFILLCSTSAFHEFKKYGETLALTGFPSLTNMEQTITLKTTDQKIISSISYTDQWYQDDYKADGGWALEQIDPNNPCSEEDNWKASIDLKGGTPGQVNSVWGPNPDFIQPELERAAVLSDICIQLFFSETYDSASALNPSLYFVDNDIKFPSIIDLMPPEYKSIILTFEQNFKEHTIYTITVGNEFSDCAGNPISDINQKRFAIPKPVENLDLIINEVLFNPLFDGVDYVEIYNRSDKTIDLNNIMIATRNEITGELKSINKIYEEGYLIFPEDYIVLTTNIAKVHEQYYSSNPTVFIQMKQMPSFGNIKGQIVILDKWLKIIDDFTYYENMHFALLNNVEGVSLERIHFERPTNDKTNWHSAAESVGFGTPSYENSQHNKVHNKNDEIFVEPEIFSPDNDGNNDIVNIHYSFGKPGYVANVSIFDSRGRFVKRLVTNELMASDGIFSWDGLNEARQKAKIGIYIFFIEVFDLDGNVKKYKKTCVLAGKIG